MVKGKLRTHRQEELAGGVMRFSRARMYHKKGLSFKKAFKPVKKVAIKQEKFVKKSIGGDKNGGERVVLKERRPKAMASEKTRRLPKRKRKAPTPAKLRASIAPGAVLIMLTSAHKGKRVVFLKQLPSGLLLVTGPMPLNGCPLRRVDQTNVIATKTRVDISKVTVPDHLDDEYFRRQKVDRRRKETEGDIFAAKKQKYEVTDKRKEDQRTVDTGIMAAVTAHPEKNILRGYLATPFGLKRGQAPHNMVF